jgi:spermidine synthase
VLSPVELAVVVSGVVGMGLQLLAGRLLAPTFGSSVHTWGSVIGVSMVALSAGYALGGRRSAGETTRGGLAAVVGYASVWMAGLVVADGWVLSVVAAAPLPVRAGPVVAVAVLVGPPTLALGAVSPYAAELVSGGRDPTAAEGHGSAAGRVYALGTAGSILGAFGTTFVLVPVLGMVGVGVALGALLVVAAGGVVPGADARGWTRVVGAGFVLVAATGVGVYGGGAAVVYETSTPYQELEVADRDGVRTLYLDGAPHSATYLDGRSAYVFEYPRYFHLSMLLAEDVDRVLFVGGGGFSGPERFLREYPNFTVDVVELDPAVVRAADRYFGVNRSHPRLNVHVGDGRAFLESTNRTYDVVVLDAYRKDRVPFHLTTVEFMRLASAHLDADGVAVANVITAPAGPGSAFFRAEYRTMQAAFSRVYAFPTARSNAVQNVELVATKQDVRVTEAELRRLNRERDVGLDLSTEIGQYRGPSDVNTSGVPVLRDDHAPVDALVQPQVGREYVVARNGSNGTATAG